MTIFTQHAFDRVTERLSLSQREVAQILDSGETIPLGLERGSNKMHRLFYSSHDNQCFVAVQDDSTGEVITILPPDFDRHCRVSLDTVNQLQLQAQEKLQSKSYDAEAVVTEKQPQVGIYFKLYFSSIHQDKPRIRNMKLSAGNYPGGILGLRDSPEVEQIVRSFAKLNIREGEYLTQVLVHFGKHGVKTRFELQSYNLEL